MSNPVNEEEWTRIRIQGPLPMGVAGALMQMIGNAWPEAMIESDSLYALSMRVPSGKTPENLDQEFLDALRAESDDAIGEFQGFEDGWIAFAPPEELCLHLGNVAHSIFTAHEPQAINHVEWTVTTGPKPDDPGYVLSISKSKEQTPLAMRKKAEAEVERLRALLQKNGIDADA